MNCDLIEVNREEAIQKHFYCGQYNALHQFAETTYLMTSTSKLHCLFNCLYSYLLGIVCPKYCLQRIFSILRAHEETNVCDNYM